MKAPAVEVYDQNGNYLEVTEVEVKIGDVIVVTVKIEEEVRT